MPIRILPPEIASRIAAGEVIERPASVVKELVENSLDAGATQITVEVMEGGRKLIRVIDNGCGIKGDEVELAFKRFSTSKLSSLEDLKRIKTLGFRGEALPSIASVAQVEILTQSADEPLGTFLSLNNGEIVEKHLRGRPPGTTITVRNLFKSYPARLKFLKSPSTENAYILNLITHYAIAFPEVQFNLYIEGRPSLRTSGDGDIREAIMEIYGVEFASSLREISYASERIELRGFLAPPELCRAQPRISIFVNRRWVRAPRLLRAVEEAFSGLLEEGKKPTAFLFLTLPPEEVDVNVHPMKLEVKFAREGEVEEVLFNALRRAMGALPLRTAEPDILPLPSSLPTLRVIGQLSSSYIIAEGDDGLYLIDQHAAHERIIYESLMKRWREEGVESQGLLEPLILELSPAEEEALRKLLPLLFKFGFSLEPFGVRTYLIRAVPRIIEGGEAVEAIREIISSEGEGVERIASSLACRSAIKSGQTLSGEEMRELVRELERTPRAETCPHGRPVILHLPSYQLERRFGRK